MDLLSNSIESIQVGVEDYQKATRSRLLSSVRNIHAGILLLYKEALLRHSPSNSIDVLIKKDIIPTLDENGEIIFIGEGNKTVNIQQIKERFKSLNINTDWKEMNSITKIRNNIEHYYPTVTQDAIRGVISLAFNIIREFISNELNEEPRELLGQHTWDIMLNVAEVYEEERRECDTLLDDIDWKSSVLERGVKLLFCSKCGSDLLKPNENTSYNEVLLVCRSCGVEYDIESYIPIAINEVLGLESYQAMKDGGEEPYSWCPECGSETYIFEEDRCALCGETSTTECIRCGTVIPASEMLSSPFCGYCEHMMNKDE